MSDPRTKKPSQKTKNRSILLFPGVFPSSRSPVHASPLMPTFCPSRRKTQAPRSIRSELAVMALLFPVVISSAMWSTTSWRQFRIAFLQEASLYTRSLVVGGTSAFQPIAAPCCPSLIFMGGSSGSAVSFTQAAQDASCHELAPTLGTASASTSYRYWH